MLHVNPYSFAALLLFCFCFVVLWPMMRMIGHLQYLAKTIYQFILNVKKCMYIIFNE